MGGVRRSNKLMGVLFALCALCLMLRSSRLAHPFSLFFFSRRRSRSCNVHGLIVILYSKLAMGSELRADQIGMDFVFLDGTTVQGEGMM
ncbi:hypothetical protein P170DRAFT_36290 [Aspergillus steynii IBT 23096]|uniref:Uncharacterized protein n=1 Tax=Aspergillus steynii IBT 23096 TaxID=1392250 RepID=A0A2I2GQT9_9EURO|nr:uncharacterized protein P170DRAFT_36290 [Aspergillus steynii IBT 23096]PLB55245.1 hypothetical protein P170DRAFT_36290 [Aspergillus steynii IBT 23096]